MLLRRVIGHVRSQDWFAVCLDCAIAAIDVELGQR